MALHLRQIKIGTASARDQLLRVVEKVQTEIEQAAGDRLAIDQHVLLHQMPAARPDEHKHRELLVQFVFFPFRTGESNRAPDRIAQIDLALDHVAPSRRIRVFEIGHENLCAGIERVDHHLAIGRPGDLDPAIPDVGRNRRAFPIAFADLFRFAAKNREPRRDRAMSDAPAGALNIRSGAALIRVAISPRTRAHRGSKFHRIPNRFHREFQFQQADWS